MQEFVIYTRNVECGGKSTSGAHARREEPDFRTGLTDKGAWPQPNTLALMSPSHFHHPLGTYSSVTVMNP